MGVGLDIVIDPPELQKYWLPQYSIEALISVKSLIENNINEETFSKVKQPVFLGYYYNDENEQDHAVLKYCFTVI